MYRMCQYCRKKSNYLFDFLIFAKKPRIFIFSLRMFGEIKAFWDQNETSNEINAKYCLYNSGSNETIQNVLGLRV